jgi:hypothetical protein
LDAKLTALASKFKVQKKERALKNITKFKRYYDEHIQKHSFETNARLLIFRLAFDKLDSSDQFFFEDLLQEQSA